MILLNIVEGLLNPQLIPYHVTLLKLPIGTMMSALIYLLVMILLMVVLMSVKHQQIQL